ncbi:hypothetical protein OBBRIDRAFT_842555 [Obba rivulosa]|uniref:BTB domain-containing protein n=1 Tax=Obba rivulosa TaxID=1052685 RepID=A0A8E2DKW5_9APHY|nr:hypothetical protein OBBRIDRAFT_842555 [Obba rivulosa]
MSALHAYFLLRNQQAFQRLLDGGSRSQPAQPSSSGGRSWGRPSPLTAAPQCDVNARDSLGRTVLHLAAAAPDASAPEYVRLLLAHPDINVNLKDAENHWTALHRALYHGNLVAASLLLQRADIDTGLKDYEGYTAFDLYNSTLEGTKPSAAGAAPMDLFTWGANRNAALGLGDADDRAYPEQVVIQPADGLPISKKESIDVRFSPIRVREVAMSKLHTAVVTAESRSNLRVCGFGSGGRLGPGQHTQYSLVPLPQLSQTVVSVALGQDHTLALTKSGEVFSWGLNRFSQLGYPVELPAGSAALGRLEEPIQSTARKIAGPLKGKSVKGVAACKTASACWTADEVYTWGTNSGQLGYDRAAQPVQIQPRKVTKVTQPVLSLSITDTALACLLETQDVICIWNDGHFKVNFPAHAFPSEITVYRPPQAYNNASIKKITACEGTFAALSSNGELFTFTLPAAPDASAGADAARARPGLAPQRVWALRKQWSAVTDVALGADGAIAVCTEAGHVFVRARSAKAQGAKAFRFQRVPYVQRVVRVCANATGALGALRVEHVPEPVRVVGNLIQQDLAAIQPFVRVPLVGAVHGGTRALGRRRASSVASTGDIADSVGVESDDEAEDLSIQRDIKRMKQLCSVLERDRESRKAHGRGVFEGVPPAHGADLTVQVQSAFAFPAHRVILAARCQVLEQVLSGGAPAHDRESNITVKLPSRPSAPAAPHTLSFTGCHPATVLILLSYLYSDEILAPWDPRIGRALAPQLAALSIRPAQTKAELQALARLLELPRLAQAIEPPVKRAPAPAMREDMARLFGAAQVPRAARGPLAPDVVLQLGDREVRCHAAVLRARSPFFRAFFDDPDWTARRWTPEGTVVVDLGHLRWRHMEFVLRHVCCGGDVEMFDTLEFIDTVDELINFMFEVMAAANELLLDRLVLVCSAVILKWVNINNVSAILANASFLHAMPLVRSLHDYMAACMETLLESRMLEDLPPDLVKQLSIYVRQQQARKYPVSRSNKVVDKAMAAYGDWLAQQDLPQVIVPVFRSHAFRDSPKLSPPGSGKKSRTLSVLSPPASPVVRPQIPVRPPAGGSPDDEIFVMDADVPALPPARGDATPVRTQSTDAMNRPTGGWKTTTPAPRVDMKAIMAEAQINTSRTPSRVPSSVPPSGTRTPTHAPAKASLSGNWRAPPLQQPATPGPPTANMSSTPMSGTTGGTRSTDDFPTPAAASTKTPIRTPPATPRKTPAAPGLGPTITPSRQPTQPKSSPVSIRKVSSGSAWTLPPVRPVVQTQPSGPAPSFVAIQQMQLEQDETPAKDKRSLLQIQEEERARQVEEDFMRWWAAEEARLHAEQEAETPQRSQKPRKTKKPKPKPTDGGSQAHDQERPDKPKDKRADGDSQRQGQDREKPRPSRKPRPPKHNQPSASSGQ